MNAYEEWRKSEHRLRLVGRRFGQGSKQSRRMREVSEYWQKAWAAEGCPIETPPIAKVLEDLIRVSEIKMREHQKAKRLQVDRGEMVRRRGEEKSKKSNGGG